eukprot:2955799-Amphidinium_carterae.1
MTLGRSALKYPQPSAVSGVSSGWPSGPIIPASVKRTVSEPASAELLKRPLKDPFSRRILS